MVIKMAEDIKLQCLDCGYVDHAHKFPDISQDPDDPAYCEPYCPYCISTRVSATVRERYIPISYVSGKLHMQNQYLSHYLGGLDGSCGYPDLSEGIRWVEETEGNYHSIWIHEDDVPELMHRVLAHRRTIEWYDVPETCVKSENGKHLITTHEDEETLYCVRCGITYGKVIE